MPLIVLTADRPPELRDVGAGQTIDQVQALRRRSPKWFVEVGDARRDAPSAMRWIRALACRAVWTALGDRPGPVHLNFPLREPLVLDAPLPTPSPRRRATRRPRRGSREARRARRPAPALPRARLARLRAARAVVGRAAGERRRAASLRRPRRRARCWPTRCRAPAAAPAPSPTTTRCCATPASPRRTRPTSCCASATCRPPSRCASGWPASTARAGRARPRGRLAGPGAASCDARFAAGPAAALRERRRWTAPTTAGLGALARRRRARRAPRHRRRARRRRSTSRGSPRALGAALPPGATRRGRGVDADPRRRDVLARRRDPPPRVLANRGANGIDGTHRHRLRRWPPAPRAPTVRSCSATSPSPTTSAACSTARAPGRAADHRASSTTAAAASSTSCRSPTQGDHYEEHVAHADRPRRRARRGAVRRRATCAVEDLGAPARRPRPAPPRRHDDPARPHRPRGQRRAAPPLLGGGRRGAAPMNGILHGRRRGLVPCAPARVGSDLDAVDRRSGDRLARRVPAPGCARHGRRARRPPDGRAPRTVRRRP